MGKKPTLTLMDYGNICDLLDNGKTYREVVAVTGFCAATVTRTNAFRRSVMRGDIDEVVRMKNTPNYPRTMCKYVEKRYGGSAENAPKPFRMNAVDIHAPHKETVRCNSTSLLLHGLDALVNAMNRIADEMARMNGKVVQ